MKNFFYLNLIKPMKRITNLSFRCSETKKGLSNAEKIEVGNITPLESFDRLTIVFDTQKKGLYDALLEDEIQLPQDLFKRFKHEK